MSKLQTFRAVVNEQLAAVAEEISALFERTIAEYEDEICRSKKENQRKRQLLDTVLNPRIPLLRVDTGPRLNQGHLTEIPQIKEEPEEQSSVTHEEVQLPVPIPRSSAVCVKIEVFSLPQKRQQTKHREETQGEDISSEPHFHSATERPTEHFSETDMYEDWAAPMEAEADGNQRNQVQTSDKDSKLCPQNKAASEISGTVKNGQKSATDGGAQGKKHLASVWEKRDFAKSHTDLQWPIPRSSAVCVKTEEFSLPQKRQQTKHREETQGEDISSEPHFHSATERPTEHFSETDIYEDWAAPMEAETDGNQRNQVQTSDKSTKLCPQNKAAPETSGTVKNGQMSATDGRAQGKKHLASVCQKTLGKKGTLQNHTQIHTGEKPYNCSLCKKTFVRKDNFVTHKRTHTGERPYSCSVCMKTFGRTDILSIHKRTHTGERPYSCPVCMKTFGRTDILNIHKRTHTGEKPYSCPLCSKAFSLQAHLKRHISSIHRGHGSE